MKTSWWPFDTAIADLTDNFPTLSTSSSVVSLRRRTDINRALAYCQQLITRPSESILVPDLGPGTRRYREEMLRRVAELLDAGVTVVALLALSDSGAPAYDHEHAAALAALGVPTFACTPDLFPDLLAVAIGKGDIARWAAMVASEAAAPSRVAEPPADASAVRGSAP